MTIKLMNICIKENGKSEFVIQLDDTRTMFLHENDFIIITDDGDGEPIRRKYDFYDLEVMSDAINEINAPLYEDRHKLTTKVTSLKKELKDKSQIKQDIKPATKENIEQKNIYVDFSNPEDFMIFLDSLKKFGKTI